MSESQSGSGGAGRMSRFARKTPEGDTQPRLVCGDCGFIIYENPKVVVGVVASWEDRILLCRRAIPPRKGFWTLPAGYLEVNESALDGARRRRHGPGIRQLPGPSRPRPGRRRPIAEARQPDRPLRLTRPPAIE